MAARALLTLRLEPAGHFSPRTFEVRPTGDGLLNISTTIAGRPGAGSSLSRPQVEQLIAACQKWLGTPAAAAEAEHLGLPA